MGCGLGHGRFLRAGNVVAGNVVELEVERIGVLRNRVVADNRSHNSTGQPGTAAATGSAGYSGA
jgi:hypothetical protein